MARRGAMAKNPPLRGKARRDFRQTQREAIASGGSAPTQDQFRPQPQLQSQPQSQPQQQSYDQARQAALGAAQQAMQQQPAPDQGGQMPPDKMYRFPKPAGGQGAALGAAMGNLAGSRQEGSPLAQQYMQQQPKRPPVFNAFPGNNPANLNQGNLSNSGDVMYPGGSATFDETGGNRGFSFDQLGALIQKGQVQNGLGNSIQMPQPSANNGGKYRLSPGVYGTREQAMGQWARQPAVQGAVNAPGSLSQFDLSQIVPYGQRRR